MNKQVQKIVNGLGWALFAIVYSGLIVALLWYIFDVKDGGGMWSSLSIFAQVGLLILGAGALVLYTIVMFFIQMGLESIWIRLLKSMQGMRNGLDKAKSQIDGGKDAS